MINKESIPSLTYLDDYNYLVESLFPETTQEISGQHFNLITINHICNFFEYFIKDDSALNRYLEKFLSETIFQNSLVKVFFEDEKGWHNTSFNSVTNKFNNTNLGCQELSFCRESFLKSVTFTSLYKNLDNTAFVKAVGIRPDYEHDFFAEDILDLKYYLDTEIDLRKTPPVKKSKTSAARVPSRFTKMIKSLKAKPEYNSWEKLWNFIYNEAIKGTVGNQVFRDAYEFSEFKVKQNTAQQEISFETVESKKGSSMKKSSFKAAYNRA